MQLLVSAYGLNLIDVVCMSLHFKFLQEIAIIIILIFYLNFPASNVLNLLLFILSVVSPITLEKFVLIKNVLDV